MIKSTFKYFSDSLNTDSNINLKLLSTSKSPMNDILMRWPTLNGAKVHPPELTLKFHEKEKK